MIHENTFNGLTSFKKVVLSYNQLNRLDPNVFNELTNLQDIDVCNNKVKVIHETTFNGLTNLNQKYFSENQIKKIHQNTFFFINNLYIYIYTYLNIFEYMIVNCCPLILSSNSKWQLLLAHEFFNIDIEFLSCITRLDSLPLNERNIVFKWKILLSCFMISLLA